MDDELERLESFKDPQARFLFNKPYAVLTPGEQHWVDEYVHDLNNPIWRPWEEDGTKVIEVNQTGGGRYIDSKLPVRIIRGGTEKTRYDSIAIITPRTGEEHMRTLHRVVATLFVPNPDNKPQVNHKDGNKLNNWYRNLEWVTASENQLHAVKSGLSKPKSGEDNPMAKYTDSQIHRVCMLLRDHPDWTYDDIMNITDVDVPTISQIYRKKTRRSIVNQYEFPPRKTVIKYSEDKLRLVCELLLDHSDWSFNRIGQSAEVDGGTVQAIYHGNNWTNISKDYHFPVHNGKARGELHHHSSCSTEQIEQVCKLLDEKFHGTIDLNYEQISHITGVSRAVVIHVAAGESWVHVAKDYDFYKANYEKEKI